MGALYVRVLYFGQKLHNTKGSCKIRKPTHIFYIGCLYVRMLYFG
jgi:hypothetical protein